MDLSDGTEYMLKVLDTAGDEAFDALRDGNIRDCEAFMVCYSVTDYTSFESVGS